MPATAPAPAAEVRSSFTAGATFADGNDATLLGLVPETAKIMAELEKAAPAEETEEPTEQPDQSDLSDQSDESEESGEAATETTEEEATEEQELATDPAARVAALEAELAEAKAGRPVVIAADPLSHIAEPSQLDALETQCTDTLDWISDNPDGGEVPEDLAEQLLGKKPDEPLIFDRDQVRALKTRARDMLKKAIPARKQFLATESAVVAEIRQIAPELFDPKSEESKLVNVLLSNIPALKSHPQWAAFARDWVAGYKANQAKQAAKKGAKPGTPGAPAPKAKAISRATGKPVPLAPAASAGGVRPQITPALNAEIRKATERINAGKGTDADFQTILRVSE